MKAAQGRIMLVGERHSGKEGLISLLTGGQWRSRRVLAVEFCGVFVNTPGEFLENRRFYRALITAAMGCSLICFLQNARSRTSLFPPRFARMFNCATLGIATACQAPDASPERAVRFLNAAGLTHCLSVDLESGAGLNILCRCLREKGGIREDFPDWSRYSEPGEEGK